MASRPSTSVSRSPATGVSSSSSPGREVLEHHGGVEQVADAGQLLDPGQPQELVREQLALLLLEPCQVAEQ